MIIIAFVVLSLIIFVGLDKSLKKYSNFIIGLVKPESTNKDKFKNLLLFNNRSNTNFSFIYALSSFIVYCTNQITIFLR